MQQEAPMVCIASQIFLERILNGKTYMAVGTRLISRTTLREESNAEKVPRNKKMRN